MNIIKKNDEYELDIRGEIPRKWVVLSFLFIYPACVAAYFLCTSKNRYNAWKVSQIAAMQKHLKAAFVDDGIIDQPLLQDLLKFCDTSLQKEFLLQMNFLQLMVAKASLGDAKLAVLSQGLQSAPIKLFHRLRNPALAIDIDLICISKADPAVFVEVERLVKSKASEEALTIIPKILFLSLPEDKEAYNSIQNKDRTHLLYRHCVKVDGQTMILSKRYRNWSSLLPLITMELFF